MSSIPTPSTHVVFFETTSPVVSENNKIIIEVSNHTHALIGTNDYDKGKGTIERVPNIRAITEVLNHVANREIQHYFASDAFSEQDYEQRLLFCPEDEEYRQAKAIVYADPRIEPLLTSLHQLLEHVPEQKKNILLAKLEKEFLEAWILTKVEKTVQWLWNNTLNGIMKIIEDMRDFQGVTLKHNDFSKLSKAHLRAFIESIRNARRVDLGGSNICQLEEARIRIIMEGIRKARIINLWNINLGSLNESCLKAFAEAIRNARSVDLENNNLHALDETCLKVLMNGTRNAWNVNLRDNNIGTREETYLKILMSAIHNACSVDLWYNNLNELSGPLLKIVADGLQKTRSISLDGNNLGELEEDDLWMLMGGIQYTLRISLKYNKLELLDNLHLRIITEGIRNARYVNFEGNNFSPEQKSFIRSLVPDTCAIIFSQDCRSSTVKIITSTK